MNEDTLIRLEESFSLLAPRGEELVDRFYTRLFENYPQVRPLFPDDVSEQKKKLLSSIVLVMRTLRRLDQLRPALIQLGAKHEDYGVQPAHYAAVRETLVSVMAEMAGDAWSPQLTQDWSGALDFVSSVMIEGQEEAAKAQAV